MGRGDKALLYLCCYLYRGGLPEKNIPADDEGAVTFQHTENSGGIKTRTLIGGESLWHLLLHVRRKRI